ncbi:outer membrane beta-barrel protein [Pedobacter nanyangensis]|uniref:outer membrane beta-barrel protein n=1 Tax=Pedobacter nanyangensis TaxID=1562389 RepID=UPI0013B43FFF|nr:outer membrane beta-barrel protein [Pedobacter nanyangensis]
MKKQFLTAIAVTLCLYGHAQTEKGKVVIGGSIGFGSTNHKANSEQKVTSFNLGPSTGFFVGKNALLGIELRYSYEKRNPIKVITAANGTFITNEIGGDKTHNYLINPFFRYYLDLHEKIKLFGQVNAGVMLGNTKEIIPIGPYSRDGKTTSYLAGIQPGIAIFPHKNIAIELKVGLFNYFNQKFSGTDTDANDYRIHQFSFGSDLNQPRLGINFHF